MASSLRKREEFGTTRENFLYNGAYILDKFEPQNERVLVKMKRTGIKTRC